MYFCQNRYMKRRCDFLDNAAAYNFNSGRGEPMRDDEGKVLKDNKGRVKYTDTSKLGSTLMETMLSEVSDFCDPSIKESWLLKPHQQVCS